MTRDYHAEGRDIAARLRQQGLTAEAQSLVDAIEGGSTGTEILMALRWHLDRIEKGGAVKDTDTQRLMTDLSGAISSALGR